MTEDIMTLSDVTVSQGDQLLLRHVSGTLTSGTMTAIVGENGCGKSTLLRLLTGTPNHDASVSLLGRSLQQWTLKDIARHRAVMQQTPASPFAFMTDEILLLGRSLYHEPFVHRLAWMEQVAQWFELQPLLNRDIQRLSGGERQRIFLAKAVMQLFSENQAVTDSPDLHGKLLLLDEPTSALDLRYQRLVMEQLGYLTRLGLCIVCISHDINLVSPYCQQMWVLGEQRCIAQGSPADVLTLPVLTRCYRTAEIELIPRPGKPPLVAH
ncbi:ATP-binding cassette domain-containing protein [Alteromonas gilva]|uniref:ATP-binding cassette domain-containing protein n=1 Tax=Alteromonas gilva TaxID=2987522 RepID=A0ABT5KZ12_9ALTE|nr:ATP-binding cassette domain-containing protein [Alteromonas gilva]MDC8830009.1 ATP-binding cassette domain-containing protein [Alteromonas gilva]